MEIELRTAAERFAAIKNPLADTCADMARRFVKYGGFASPKQEAFARSLVAQANVPCTELATFAAVKGALDAAYSRGLRRPAMHITRASVNYTFKRAPDSGKNPGNVYVTRGTFPDVYVGKIAPSGQFSGAYACGPDDVAALEAIAVDPLAAARESGKLTGRCSCCGRELSDPVSIQNGIGPICESKYFGRTA